MSVFLVSHSLLLTPGGLHSAAFRVSSVLHSPSLPISLKWVAYAPSIKCVSFPLASWTWFSWFSWLSDFSIFSGKYQACLSGALRSAVLRMFFSGSMGHPLWPKCHLLSEIPAAFLPNITTPSPHSFYSPSTIYFLLHIQLCLIQYLFMYLCLTRLVSASKVLRYLALLPD